MWTSCRLATRPTSDLRPGRQFCPDEKQVKGLSPPHPVIFVSLQLGVFCRQFSLCVSSARQSQSCEGSRVDAESAARHA